MASLNTTKREIELEMQLWQERADAIRNGMNAINLQAQLLNLQSTDVNVNIARLTAELQAKIEAEGGASTPPTPDSGGGPGEEH